LVGALVGGGLGLRIGFVPNLPLAQADEPFDGSIVPVERVVWSWRGVPAGLGAGFIATLCASASTVVSGRGHSDIDLFLALVSGVAFGLLAGITSGASTMQVPERELRRPNQQITMSAQSALIVGAVTACVVAPVLGLGIMAFGDVTLGVIGGILGGLVLVLRYS
jgi:hypothetical protein